MTFIAQGIFANGHLKMEHARDKGPAGMPSLTAMTTKAIQVLKKNQNGFILMVSSVNCYVNPLIMFNF